MQCRLNCGACCIAPSITSFIPGMPEGKPAGVRCIHLANDNSCQLFNSADRPEVCKSFLAEVDVCGENREKALEILKWLEEKTAKVVQ
ncbi:MAG: Fe-S-cluster containining protein [Oceanicoccus sp.]|jgi:Fe-S-cluster containining protein